MDWARLVVDAVSALAWPLVALAVALTFKTGIRTKLADLLHLKAGSLAEFEFTRPVATAEGVPTKTSAPARPPASEGDVGDEQGKSETGPSGFSRGEIEDLLREAVRWGYERGGDPDAPVPKISWDRTSGRPDLQATEVTTRYFLYQDKSGNFRFRVMASNGEVLAVGPAFDTNVEAERVIQRLAHGKGVYAEIYQDAVGRFRFRIRADDRQVLAVGEVYDTKASAILAVERLGIPPTQIRETDG